MTSILRRLAQVLARSVLARSVLALSIVVLSAPLAAPARAQEVTAGDLVITQAWSRATPGGAKVAGGYLTIENKGSAPDRLIGGSSDIAAKVQVHEMATNNGVMTMRPLDSGLTIEPGKTVTLAPGGYHLMMLDLKGPLKRGDKLAGKPIFRLTVVGRKSGEPRSVMLMLVRRAAPLHGQLCARRHERLGRSGVAWS